MALRYLYAQDKAGITPLIEITPRSIAPRHRHSTLPQMLEKNVLDIQKNWGMKRLFVDLWHVNSATRVSGQIHPVSYVAEQARNLGVQLVPVTGLARPQSYQAAVASVNSTDRRGVCIRLLGEEIQDSAFSRQLLDLTHHLRVKPEDVDLIIDFQVVDSTCPSYVSLCARVPSLPLWRSFTIASGAFPMDLTGFRPGQHTIARIDWLRWLCQVGEGPPLVRVPDYSDYAIQYGHYREPPDRANPSASIRYTAEDDWIIMRGEALRHDDSPGPAQWPANAQLLSQRSEFCGRDFSEGDRYIYEMASQPQTNGSFMTWLRAGINHHLTFVVRQIARLSET